MSSAPPPPRHRSWLWFAGWVLLALFFVAPPRESYDHGLDHSNYATYARFFAERAQWGEDVLPMAGPFGFLLYSHTYTGELFGLRLVADVVLKAVFSALLLHLFRRAGPGAWRWAWLAGVVVLVPLVDDLFHDFAILVATLCLFAHAGPRMGGWARLALGLLGFLALFKGTHLLTATLCFGTVLLQYAVARQIRAGAILLASYAGTVIAFWCLAGQNPAHLPGYIRAVLELSSGYNATMGLDAPPFYLGLGLALAAGLLALFAGGVLAAGRSPVRLLPCLLLAGFAFIKWKHGFLRADGHVAIFFASTGVIALTFALVSATAAIASPAAAPGRTRRIGLLALVTGLAGLSLLATLEFNLALAGRVLVGLPGRLQTNVRWLARPGVIRAALEEKLAANRREADVPQIRNEVGRDSIDFFGFEQGLLLLNGLNYTPRPMGGGSFNVFTPWLQDRNEAFVRDSRRAPRWQVMRLRTLDHRLPAADDPLTLAAILHGYSPVLLQRDYLLLKRRPRPSFPAPAPLGSQALVPGQPVMPPDPGPGQLLLFTLEARLTLAGRLRSFLYRPPLLAARLGHNRPAAGRDFVLRPLMLQRPVILSPLLIDNADVIELYGDDPGNRVRSLELLPVAGYATDSFRIKYYSLPRPAPPEDGDVNELKTYHRHPLHNRPPVRLDAPPTGILELNKEPITSLHAPGSVTWDLREGDQQFIFSYGMMPRTWLEGDTDGVEFNVEVLWPPNDGRILFQHMVRPRLNPADQAMQRARIFLPPYRPGAQVRVRVHPGQDNNANYDQSYVTRVQIKAGPLVPEQFNGLGVVPANRELPAKAIAGIGDRPVFLIHAPDEVILELPPGARQFSAEIGLLPGAYTGAGASDGVVFTATLLQPDGRRQVLATRLLNPRQVPDNRGPQQWAFALPLAPAGSRLSISTDVGPNGDRGWDQSYVAGASFQ